LETENEELKKNLAQMMSIKKKSDGELIILRRDIEDAVTQLSHWENKAQVIYCVIFSILNKIAKSLHQI
jgi:hypothetical protein